MEGRNPTKQRQRTEYLNHYSFNFPSQYLRSPTVLPDVKACSYKDSFSQIVKIKPQFGSCDHKTCDGSENDGGLEDKTAGDATEDHTGLGKAGHEVEQTWPATEE